LGIIAKSKPKPCSRCAKCCITQPCALAPNDLFKIANHFGLSERELFTRFLVLDYVEISGEKHYYVCPARNNDQPGTIVKSDWAFSNSPCGFLDGNDCSIERVKPEGGRKFHCSLITSSNRNLIGYSKKNSASDWSRSNLLDKLVTVARVRRLQVIDCEVCR
jgi:Fe-S-cluster containining protein